MSTSILLVGLPWDHPAVAAHHNPEVIRVALDKTQTIMETAGYDYLFLAFGPESGVVPLEQAIARKTWDAIVVGYGIRGATELSYFMEQIVNTIVKKSPSSTILFNVSPESTLEAAERWFGQKSGAV